MLVIPHVLEKKLKYNRNLIELILNFTYKLKKNPKYLTLYDFKK